MRLQVLPTQHGDPGAFYGVVSEELGDVTAQLFNGLGVATALGEFVVGVEPDETVLRPYLGFAVLLDGPPRRGRQHVEAFQALRATGDRGKDAKVCLSG